jgi:RNA polymerase sigma-70 factor (ECF subfamily)
MKVPGSIPGSAHSPLWLNHRRRGDHASAVSTCSPAELGEPLTELPQPAALSAIATGTAAALKTVILRFIGFFISARLLSSELVSVVATKDAARGRLFPPLCSPGRIGRIGHHAMERTLDPARLGDHLDRLYRAAWALCGSREEAEDLVQETYARVLARPRLLRNEDDLGYLLRALRNTFLTQKRTESRRLRPGPLPEQLDLVADPQAREPQAALEAGELYAAVAALPGDFRDVLVAVDITGLSYKEAARALRIREGTVMSRLYRARQQVVRRIEGGPA